MRSLVLEELEDRRKFLFLLYFGTESMLDN